MIFRCRKIILKYFGEDTNQLESRSDCCDNCAKGLSTWKLRDLFYGVDFRGHYDFARDAEILLNAIACMQSQKIDTFREQVVNLLRGNYNPKLVRLPQYGIGRARQTYYWEALIDQLTFGEYLDFVAGKTCLTLSDKAQRWRLAPSPKVLSLKPVGAMYRFLKRKPSTPITNAQWKSGYTNSTANYSYNYRNTALDLFFGQCVFCDHHGDDDSDDIEDSDDDDQNDIDEEFVPHFDDIDHFIDYYYENNANDD